jgi:hypothetical protein
MSALHLSSVLWSPVILAAGAAMWWNTYCDEHKFDQAKRWPSAQGVVIETKKTYFQRINRLSHYAVAVFYSYDVGGTRYVAMQDQFLDHPYGKPGFMISKQGYYYLDYEGKRIVSEYMKGSISEVHYNPQKPSTSFVDIKFTPCPNFYSDQIMSIGFMCFGFVGLLFGAAGFDRGY